MSWPLPCHGYAYFTWKGRRAHMHSEWWTGGRGSLSCCQAHKPVAHSYTERLNAQQSWPQRSLFLQKWLHSLVLPNLIAKTKKTSEILIWEEILRSGSTKSWVTKCSALVCSRCFPLRCSLICRRQLSLSIMIMRYTAWIINCKPPGSRVVHVELLLDV